MTDILDDLKAVKRNNGHTYSSYEVLGMVSRAIEEIEALRQSGDRAAVHHDQREPEPKRFDGEKDLEQFRKEHPE